MVHNKIILFKGQTDRDDFLGKNDIINLENKIKQKEFKFHENDGQSTLIWQVANLEKVFYYQDYHVGEIEGVEQLFILGIQLPNQLEWMIKQGYNSLIEMDSIFGTNKMNFSLYTLLLFDYYHNGLPVTWVIYSRI